MTDPAPLSALLGLLVFAALVWLLHRFDQWAWNTRRRASWDSKKAGR